MGKDHRTLQKAIVLLAHAYEVCRAHPQEVVYVQAFIGQSCKVAMEAANTKWAVVTMAAARPGESRRCPPVVVNQPHRESGLGGVPERACYSRQGVVPQGLNVTSSAATSSARRRCECQVDGNATFFDSAVGSIFLDVAMQAINSKHF